MVTIKIIKEIKEMQVYSNRLKQEGKTIAFVTTMGFLHEGHISLIRKGKKLCDKLVVSIFVNPTQFGQTEDFDTYPRGFEKDCVLLKQEKADIVFAPEAERLYPEQYQTYVNLLQLPNNLCGLSRPTFFKGVTTIVTKLFNIVKPDKAVFGQKDFQQLLIIRQMVKDLNFDIGIEAVPIVREKDGLAISSRNVYLSPEQKPAALTLYKTLEMAKKLVVSGEKKSAVIIDKASILIESFPETFIDYISICDPETLEELETVKSPALMALAVKIGTTRLIDNTILSF